MKLSELSGKEIVNLHDGARLGIIRNCDLVIDENTGKILYFLIPKNKNLFLFLNDRNYSEVTWEAIKKIGPDIVIIDVENQSSKRIMKL